MLKLLDLLTQMLLLIQQSKVIVIGIKTMSGLDAGDLYFLSPSTAGAITLTPPSSAGQAVVRVGEASTATTVCYSN